MNAVSSSSIDQLTSPSLTQLQEMLVVAKAQQAQVREDSAIATKELEKNLKKRKILSIPIIKQIASAKLSATEEEISYFRGKLLELNDWMAASQVYADFDTNQAAQVAFRGLIAAYERLRASNCIWDVTADRNSISKADRTIAGRIVDRVPVRFDYAQSEFVQFSGRALRLQNANGEDLLIYPGVILMERRDGRFALIAIQEITLNFGQVSFVETSPVPSDSRVIGNSWAKVNKDGSPDKRYANNYQIPICEYGNISFSSPSGLREEFHISNLQAALAFGQAFRIYQQAL